MNIKILKNASSASEILDFFDNDERGLHHTNYYHYTKLETIKHIFQKKSIFLTQLKRDAAGDITGNDKQDVYPENVFTLCFATGTSESLPLWYLYSGIDGKGARIGIKKATFAKWINNLSFTLAEWKNKTLVPESLVFLNNCQYHVKLRDILYLGKDTQNKNTYRAKYGDCVKNGISTEIYSQIKEEYGDFIKGLIWFYEKESRLQVTVTDRSLIDPEKDYVLMTSIESIQNELSVRLAPEFENACDVTLFDNADSRNPPLHLELSDYAGMINMRLKKRLCEECENFSQRKDGKS